MKVLIYENEKYLKPTGGPAGYCYNILIERNKRKDERINFIVDKKENKTIRTVKNLAKKMIINFKSIGNSVNPDEEMVRLIRKTREDSQRRGVIDLSGYDVVHFESTFDLYKKRTDLENYNGIVVLTSHSPKVFHREIIEDYTKKEIYEKHKKIFDEAEEIDEYAFKRADYIIFPCAGAEEPYFHSWKKYEELRDPNKIKYVPTGVIPVTARKTREEIRKQYHIPDDAILLSFVGRHNLVKGYDLLIDIFNHLNQDNIYVICCGKVSEIKYPQSERWIEVGWTDDPYSIVNASDIYILPNRETYFDIAMLQALSLGKISLLTYTGGNKEFSDTPGVYFFDEVESAIESIRKITKLEKEEILMLEEKQRQDFALKYDIGIFYDKYLETLVALVCEKNNYRG